MYRVDDVIDGLFNVTGICSDSGGMGIILYVEAPNLNFPFPVVLKYCRAREDEYINRFRREIRILKQYQHNSKVATIVHSNLDHKPPYFVMRYYPDGDLSKFAASIRDSPQILENVILQMIDALSELHSNGHFHRDIKPQNFLVHQNTVLISDFGISTESGSGTAFTRTSQWGGTHGYLPPEFLNGQFKNADATSDIYMLGKTIYSIATGLDVTYINKSVLPGPLFHIIDKCCDHNKSLRFQSLGELRQAVIFVFDVLLARGDSAGTVNQTMNSIISRYENENLIDLSEVKNFVTNLSSLTDDEKILVCLQLPEAFFLIISNPKLQSFTMEFIKSYDTMVERQGYEFTFATTIAKNMKIIFENPDNNIEIKSYALELCIKAAVYKNRWDAMKICEEFIQSIRDDALASFVAALIHKHKGTFVDEIEILSCKNPLIVRAIQSNKIG
jgi:eukaryotic-like serine/threonine-protein kinase